MTNSGTSLCILACPPSKLIPSLNIVWVWSLIDSQLRLTGESYCQGWWRGSTVRSPIGGVHRSDFREERGISVGYTHGEAGQQVLGVVISNLVALDSGWAPDSSGLQIGHIRFRMLTVKSGLSTPCSQAWEFSPGALCL